MHLSYCELNVGMIFCVHQGKLKVGGHRRRVHCGLVDPRREDLRSNTLDMEPVTPATTVSIRLLPTSQVCTSSHTHYNNQHQTPSHLTGLYTQPYLLQQSASDSCPPHRYVHPVITTTTVRLLPTSQVCTPSHTRHNSQHQTPSHLTGMYTQSYPSQQSASDSFPPHRFVHPAIPATTISIRLLPTSQVCTLSHTHYNSQ